MYADKVIIGVHELDNPRKRRATEYVFSLQSTPDVPTPTQRAPPAVRKIKELHRSASSQALGISSAPISRAESPAVQSLQETNEQPAVGSSTIQSAPATTPGTPNDSADALQQFKASQPRRFHISRSSTPSLLDSTGGGNRKRKAEPTVFVERRSRPKSKDGQSPGTSTPATFDETPRPQKKPGLAARSSTQPVKAPVPKPAIAPLRNVRLQSGEVIPWDVSSERLAAEMQAYTLAEIGKNIAASQTLKREPNYTSSHIHKSTPSKFKPKAPALRYAQRHPEEKIPANHDMTMDLNGPYVEDEADDDAEYIIDTYIRMPADALETEGMPKNIGFLILDSQPDIDEFYREEEESEEEEDDLDEDENGNYKLNAGMGKTNKSYSGKSLHSRLSRRGS